MKRTHKRPIAAMITAVLILVQLAVPAAAEGDAESATSFAFTDGGITVSEGASSGYKIEGTALTLSGSGTYLLSGSCADGSVTVKKGTTGVTLILNGLTLTSESTAPICCNKSSEVTIVAAAGSVNTLTDSVKNNDESYPDNADAENAVIKGKDGSKMILCGMGTINVIANGKNGVKGGATTETEGAASLTVQELTLNITANAGDGLKSDQELNILSGTVTVNAADDAIKSDYAVNIGATGTQGPTIRIEKSSEGIEGATVNVYSGEITVHASDDGINAANSDLTGYAFACNICGGTIYIDVTKGDGIDSNGALTITGGTVEVHSSAVGFDGSPLDCEGQMTVTGGTVLAVGNSSMAQTPGGTPQTYVVFGSVGMTTGGFGRNGRNAGMQTAGSFGQNADQAPAQGGGSSANVAAGSTIAILDGNGNTLYSAKALRNANFVFFTSDALKAGEGYSLTVNGNSAATATAAQSGANGNAGMPGMNGNTAMPGMNGNAAMPGMNGNAATPGMNGNAATPGMNGNAGMLGMNGNTAMPGMNGNAAMPGGNAGMGGNPGFGQFGGQTFREMAPLRTILNGLFRMIPGMGR